MSINLNSIVNKKPNLLSSPEALLLSNYIFNYLKNDKIKDNYSSKKLSLTLTSGEKIQYVDYLMFNPENDECLEDELVFVTFDKRTGKNKLTGMNWKTNMNIRVRIAKKLRNADFKMVCLSVAADKALRKNKT